MYRNLCLFLERAWLDDKRVEVVLKDGEAFTGIPLSMDMSDDEYLGWDFDDVHGADCSGVFLKDIASVKRSDTQEVYKAA